MRNLKKGLNLLICTGGFLSYIASYSLETRKIVPPNLENYALGKRVLCYRPMRQGKPLMNIEKKGDKVILNNYGHGGSGWTLGPGCAQYVNNLLEKSVFSRQLNKNTPLTIVGAGVIGLCTAYDLVQRGYKNNHCSG